MNRPFRLAVIGPGRAGGALAIASRSAGHRVQTVPGPSGAIPPDLEATRVAGIRELSACDLLLLATPDDAIEEAARHLASFRPPARTVAHLSGFASVDRLEPLERVGMEVGCIHPLQTLPSPQSGALVLAGSTAAVTTRTQTVARRLNFFAQSLGITTFDLDDQLKPLYHAGAATIALGLATALGMAADFFDAADVSWNHAEPLARKVMENCFQLGPDRSLTGPVVRGDRGTIAGHLQAAAVVSSSLAQQYQMLGRIAASRTGVEEQARKVTDHSQPADAL